MLSVNKVAKGAKLSFSFHSLYPLVGSLCYFPLEIKVFILRLSEICLHSLCVHNGVFMIKESELSSW